MAENIWSVQPPEWLTQITLANKRASQGKLGSLLGTVAAGVTNAISGDESLGQGIAEARLSQDDPAWKLKYNDRLLRQEAITSRLQLAGERAETARYRNQVSTSIALDKEQRAKDEAGAVNEDRIALSTFIQAYQADPSTPLPALKTGPMTQELGRFMLAQTRTLDYKGQIAGMQLENKVQEQILSNDAGRAEHYPTLLAIKKLPDPAARAQAYANLNQQLEAAQAARQHAMAGYATANGLQLSQVTMDSKGQPRPVFTAPKPAPPSPNDAKLYLNEAFHLEQEANKIEATYSAKTRTPEQNKDIAEKRTEVARIRRIYAAKEPPAPAGKNNATPIPLTGERQVGQTYSLPKGNFTWTGGGWVPSQE